MGADEPEGCSPDDGAELSDEDAEGIVVPRLRVEVAQLDMGACPKCGWARWLYQLIGHGVVLCGACIIKLTMPPRDPPPRLHV
jgi:hypothetical protein